MSFTKNGMGSLIVLMLSFVAFGQRVATTDAYDAPLLENIHLHLNKTAFLKGEHLWFQAYVQDQHQGLPSLTTTNLHIGIFSDDGKAVAKKMFFVKDGIAYGDFKIDSTFVEDSYTVMAWTNFMKNFEVATPFLQKISVLGTADKNKTKAKNGITILIDPEGQRMVAGTYNRLGLMVYDGDLKPVKTDGIQLVTEDGTQIQTNIQTNEIGQARFGFFADPAHTYFIKVKDVDGAWITKKLENVVPGGLGISVDNTAKDVIVLSPKWSNSAVTQEGGEKRTLAILSPNSLSMDQAYTLEKDNRAISVNRDQLPYGINAAVVLDKDSKPISQRMFFNDQAGNKKLDSVIVRYCLTKNQDSLQIDLLLPEGNAVANLSMSVLPAGTNAHYPSNSIASSFLVQPFIERQFVDGNYFFEGTKRSRAYQMDTRLLMEGTKKFNGYLGLANTLNIQFLMEKNIAFNGKILDADTKNEKLVSLMSQSFGVVDLFDLSTHKTFTASLPLMEGDSVLVSVLNQKGKLRKPEAELYFNDHEKDTFNYKKWLLKVNQLGPTITLTATDEGMNLSDRTISLEEVVVTEKAREAKKYQITANIEQRIIDESTLKRYTFESYIRMLGFKVIPNYVKGEGGINVYVSDPPYLKQVPIFIEGMLVHPGELMSRPLSSIGALAYNKSRQAPFISLSLRYDYDELYGRDQFMSIAIPKGFSRTKAYFAPNYPDYSAFDYKKYGAIWWESQLRVDAEVPYSITVPLNEQQEVKVVVEGMSADGILYHTEQICYPFEDKYSAN